MKYLILAFIAITIYACSGKNSSKAISTDSINENSMDSTDNESIFMTLWNDQRNKPAEVVAIEKTIVKVDSICSENSKTYVSYNALNEIVKLYLHSQNESGELVTLSNQYYKDHKLFYVENLADVLSDPQSSIIFKGFISNNAIVKIVMSKTMDVNGMLINYPEIRTDQIEIISDPVEKANDKPLPVNRDYVGE